MTIRNFAIVTTLVVLCMTPFAAGKELPPAGLTNPDESTPTTLYFHAMDAQNDIPINTQKPDPSWDKGFRVGSSTNSLCFEDLHDTNPLLDKEYHTFFGYSSPSYVEYDFLTNGQPRLHPERGLSFDVELDQDSTPVLTWYLATHSGAPNPGLPEDPNQVPVVVPNVVVRGTMRESDKITVGDAGYRDGPIILQGESEPALLAAHATMGANWTQVGDLNVYEITVPLELEAAAIPRATGFNFQVEVFIENEYCSEEGLYIMPNLVDLHTSEGHRPRLDLAIMNPIRIEYLHPQFVGDELVIHSALNSPWGNYDIDESSVYNGFDGTGIVMRILDPDGNPVSGEVEQVAFVQRFHEHDHHNEAVDATYLWAYKPVRAPNGVYTVELEAWNDQRTAVARGVGQFEIGGDGEVTGCGKTDIGQDGMSADAKCKKEQGTVSSETDQGAPGLAPLAGILAVLAAAVVVRRRV